MKTTYLGNYGHDIELLQKEGRFFAKRGNRFLGRGIISGGWKNKSSMLEWLHRNV